MHEAEAEGARQGRAAARATGRRLGRPPSLTPELVLRARELLADSHATVASVARQLGVGRSSLYRHLPELTGRAQSNGRSADVDAHFARAGSDRQPDGDRSTLGPGAATGTPEGHRSRR
jgi:DNA invertase Pin-like site-specific DNA recombinase